MTTEPRLVRIVTLDTDGKLSDELTLEALLASVKESVEVPLKDLTGRLDKLEQATPQPGPPAPTAREVMTYLKTGPQQEISLDTGSQFFWLASVPYTMTFASSAPGGEVPSAQVEIIGTALGTFPQITKWHTAPPKGEGVLTVRRSTYRGVPNWHGWWSPVVL